MSSRSSSAGFSGAASSTRLKIAVFAAGVASFVNMYCTMAVLPLLAHDFHVAKSATGLTVTAPLLATAILAPIVGAISDRFGRRRLIVAAAFSLAIPTALAATAGSFPILLMWRFIQGLIVPFIFAVTVAYIGDETDGHATVRLAATYMSGAIFGGFCGRAIPGVVAQLLGWRPALLIIAALTLGLAFAIARCLPEERRFEPVHSFTRAVAAFPTHLRNPRLRATYGIGFGVLFTMIAVFTFINFRLAAPPYRFGPAALGGIFVVYLSATISTPVGARMANRYGQRKVMTVVAATTCLGLACTLARPLPLIVLGLLLISSSVFVQQTLATAFTGMAAREAKSAAIGLYVTLYYIGGSAGGILPAPLFHLFGWPGCVACVIAMQAIMLWLALRYWQKV